MRFDPEILIPILALIIPIVAILAGHQRKMAAIIHGVTEPNDVSNSEQRRLGNNLSNQFASQQELALVREEMRQMRELLQNQTFAMEELKTSLILNVPIQTRIQENA
jgi:hypothetical protein